MLHHSLHYMLPCYNRFMTLVQLPIPYNMHSISKLSMHFDRQTRSKCEVELLLETFFFARKWQFDRFKGAAGAPRLVYIIYRVAQKECNTYDQWFQENEGQNKQAVSIILRIKFYFQQDDTWPRSLILMKAFWFYDRFSEAMSFSLKICHFCLKSHNWLTRKFPLFGSPG